MSENVIRLQLRLSEDECPGLYAAIAAVQNKKRRTGRLLNLASIGLAVSMGAAAAPAPDVLPQGGTAPSAHDEGDASLGAAFSIVDSLGLGGLTQ